MNNEPVAWMLLGLEDRKPKLINLQVIEHLEGTWFPLYTHQIKELTDEEIAELSDKILCYQIYDNKESGVFEFARAILRKAQEG